MYKKDESKIFVFCDDIKLEACFTEISHMEAAIICHPHPLYGGDMDNIVVLTIKNAFNKAGISTLRFNFRGVGLSEGSYGDGDGEVQDIVSCYNFLKQKGMEEIWLGGYSFGAWVILKALSQMDNKLDISGLVLVAPPVSFLDFTSLKVPDGIATLVVVGSSDQLCNTKTLTEWLKSEQAELKIIEGADHFFFKGINDVEEYITDFIESAG